MRVAAIRFEKVARKKVVNSHLLFLNYWMRAFQATAKRVFANQKREVLRQLHSGEIRKAGIKFDPNKEGWNSIFGLQMTPIFLNIIDAAGKKAVKQSGSLGASFNVYSKESRDFLRTKPYTFADHVNTTTIDSLKRSLTLGFEEGESMQDLADRVSDVFEGTVREEGWRAMRIARTECLCGDTLICTRNGIQRIDTFAEGEVWDGHKFVFARVLNQGRKKVWELTLNNGVKIRCSENHRFRGEHSWRTLKQLSVLKNRCVRLNVNEVEFDRFEFRRIVEVSRGFLKSKFEEWVLDDFILELLGRLVGDGYVMYRNQTRLYFGRGEEEISWFASELVKRGLNICIRDYGRVKLLLIHGKGFRKFLEELGLGYFRAWEKRVPWVVFRGSIEQRKAFLRGMIGSDGGVRKDTNQPYLKVTSEGLVRDVQVIWHSLGFHAHVAGPEFYGGFANARPMWCVSRAEARERTFVRSIEFTDEKEEMYDLECFDKEHKYVANGVLVHNCNSASNFGLLEGYRQAGVGGKRWLAADFRARPDHLEANGQEVALDEPFEVGGDLLMFPGDTSLGAGPENTINCRCVVQGIVTGDEWDLEG